MRDVYNNKIAVFLPNKPVSNEEMEDYIGLIGGKPSRVRSVSILCDGTCTVCEMLYKNPLFVLGNI